MHVQRHTHTHDKPEFKHEGSVFPIKHIIKCKFTWFWTTIYRSLFCSMRLNMLTVSKCTWLVFLSWSCLLTDHHNPLVFWGLPQQSMMHGNYKRCRLTGKRIVASSHILWRECKDKPSHVLSGPAGMLWAPHLSNEIWKSSTSGNVDLSLSF